MEFERDTDLVRCPNKIVFLLFLKRIIDFLAIQSLSENLKNSRNFIDNESHYVYTMFKRR